MENGGRMERRTPRCYTPHLLLLPTPSVLEQVWENYCIIAIVLQLHSQQLSFTCPQSGLLNVYECQGLPT